MKKRKLSKKQLAKRVLDARGVVGAISAGVRSENIADKRLALAWLRIEYIYPTIAQVEEELAEISEG